MKNLFLILFAALFIIGCNQSEIISPPNNNNNTNTIVNFKETVATIIDESGDTIYSAVTNSNYEGYMKIVEEASLNDTFVYVKTNTYLTTGSPISFSIPYYFNSSKPDTGQTKLRGSQTAFQNEFEMYCELMDLSGTTWVTSNDYIFEEFSNEISSVSDLGKQSVDMYYSYTNGGVLTQVGEQRTDSLFVYRLSGGFEKEFYQKGNPSAPRKTFTVIYESVPVFLGN